MPLRATTTRLPAGGGPFRLDRLTLGVFLRDQPGHGLALGGERTRSVPLARHDGWVLPAGSEGICRFDDGMEVTLVEIDGGMLDGTPFAAAAETVHAGPLDPLLVQMALQAESFASGGTLYAETMAQAFAQTLGRSLASPEAPPLDDARLRRVAEAVRSDPAADHTVAAMADLAAMSADHFARAFKAAKGASPLQYVIGARIEAAQALLRGSDLSVAEIAHRVGYDDPSRFTRHFRARIGATPGAWRGG